MSRIIGRLLVLVIALGVSTGSILANPPYTICNSFLGYACVTPFLDSHNSGATTGEPNYPVQVTPAGGSQTVLNTNGSGQSQGYIVLIGPVGSSWLIAPNNSPITWSPAFQNVTQNTGFDGTPSTVLRPVFTCVTGCH